MICKLNGLNGATYVISSKDSNAVVWGQGLDVTATSSQLLYDFGGNGFLVFQDGQSSGQHYYCNSAVNSAACYQGISIVPNGYNDGTQDIVSMTGNDVFATGPGAVDLGLYAARVCRTWRPCVATQADCCLGWLSASDFSNLIAEL